MNQIQTHEGLHVAIIMDGNGRWASRRGMPRLAGHRAGVEAVKRVVRRAPGLGIHRLTVYAFSAHNWRRPSTEVAGIFRLLRAYLRLEAGQLRQSGVRLEVIGRRDRIGPLVRREIERAERMTAAGDRLHLRVAVDYSSREAILRAAAHAAEPRSEGQWGAPDLAGGSDDVDLLIRTGGEKRLSDFLLWEAAYAELFFTDRMWPDFRGEDLAEAVAEFGSRERRFGAVPVAAA